MLAFLFLAQIEGKANIQLPVVSADIGNVFYKLGKDIITGERLVRPSILYKWEDPQEWAPSTGNGYEQGKDDPKGYRIRLENVTTKLNQSFQVPYDKIGKHQAEVSDYLNLDTGSLYKILVRPYHYHTNPLTGDVKEAPYNGNDPYAYAITDLDVRLESTDSTISVIWDDLGENDFTYRIVYALGDYSNEGATQTFYNNREGEVKGLTVNSSDVTRFYDNNSRRNKLKYVLKEKIYPGQIYSVMVEPTVDTYKGEKVHRNRNFPLIHSVSTNVKLSYAEEGEYLRLTWKIPATFEVGKSKDKYTLTTTQLVEIVDDNERNIAIFHEKAGAVNYYLIKKPKSDTSYQLKLTYKVGSNDSKPPIQAVSNVLLYSPSELKITPTKPMIPKLTTKDMIDEWKLAGMTQDSIKAKLSKEGYFLNGYDYVGDLAEVFTKNAVFHRNKSNNSINLIWSAFRRKDIDNNSPTYNQVIADLKTFYDIAITDDFNALAEVPYLEKNLQFHANAESDLLKNSSGDIIGFRKSFNQYYDNTAKASAPFKPNKIYYIKLVAKKKVGKEELKSDPVISSFYYDELGIYAPPTLTKPPLRELKERTGKQSVTIGWREKWYEVANILDPAKVSEWYPVMYVKGDVVSPTESEGATRFDVYKSEVEVNKFLKAVENNKNYKFISRVVDMKKNSYTGSAIAYRFAEIPYADVLKAIKEKQLQAGFADYDFTQYFEDLIEKDKKGVAPMSWQKITPAPNKENQEELLHTKDGLKPNSTYLFILHPYRTVKDSGEVYAHFPTPILVSTKPEADVLNPDPTVPRLFVVDSTDTSIRLGWTYNKDFSYKIKYRASADGKEDTEVAVEVSDNPENENYGKNGEYFFFDVKGLFPDTSYDFSIQAQNKESGKTSDWSNPVVGRTKPILPPPAPPGFGIASEKDMRRHQIEKPVGKDYFSVQWLKLNEDNEENKENKVLSKTYDYILEVADNEAFIDPLVINTSAAKDKGAQVLEKTLVKINGLVPGKTYYARAKTRMTVSSGDKKLEIDSIEYTVVVRITTGLNPSEYDGDKRPNLEILPDKDFELIYDKEEKSLTFRFRYNQKDKNGKADNRVDQRLINELIRKNRYEYPVDVTKFKNKEIKKRIVEIPYPVYEAMHKHQVEMKIMAKEVEIALPMKAFEKEVSLQKQRFGAMPSIKVEMENTDKKPIEKGTHQLREISSMLQLKARVMSDKKKADLEVLSAPIEIRIHPTNRSEAYGKEIFAYHSNVQKQSKAISGNYDKLSNQYRLKSVETGVYGLFSGTEMLGKEPVHSHWSDRYRQKVEAQKSLRNLGNYQPNRSVSGRAFFNAVYAMVAKQSEIDFAGDLSGDKKRTLLHSGLLNKTQDMDGSLRRVEAFDTLVKAYEMLEDETISYNVSLVSSVMKQQKVTHSQAIALLKAESIGLLSDIRQANAGRHLSYAELFVLLSKL